MSLNRLLSTHPKGRGKLKRTDADFVRLHALQQCVPVAAGKRRVSVLVEMPGGLCDADNLLKSLADAMVTAGLLLDDSPEFVEWGSVEVRRGGLRTTITLEDLPGEER